MLARGPGRVKAPASLQADSRSRLARRSWPAWWTLRNEEPIAARRPTGCSPEAISRSISVEGLGRRGRSWRRRGVARSVDPPRADHRGHVLPADLPLLPTETASFSISASAGRSPARPARRAVRRRRMELGGNRGRASWTSQCGSSRSAGVLQSMPSHHFHGLGELRIPRPRLHDQDQGPGRGGPSIRPSSSLRWAVTKGSASSTTTTRRLTRNGRVRSSSRTSESPPCRRGTG